MGIRANIWGDSLISNKLKIMIKDITTLTLEGGCFSSKSKLKIFAQNINIIYGRNGSGKSTIAKAVKMIRDGTENADINAKFNTEPTATDKKTIFVYDEEYIDNSVKTSHDGLDTIVMLGEQNDIQADIDKLNKESYSNNVRLDELTREIEELQSDKNNKSSKYWVKNLKQALKATNAWAARDEAIIGKKIRGSVSDDLINRLKEGLIKISNVNNETNEIAIKEEFLEELENRSANLKENTSSYLSAKNYGFIADNINIRCHQPDWGHIRTLLECAVNNPNLNEREKFLLEKIKSNVLPDYLEKAQQHFNKDERMCPYCLREISEIEIEELCNTLKNILNNEVTSLKSEISKCITELDNLVNEANFNLDLESLANIPQINTKAKRAHKLLSLLKNKLLYTRDQLKLKFSHPYQLIDVSFVNKTQELFEEYTKEAEELDDLIKQHNGNCEQLEQIKAELSDENFDLAVIENHVYISNLIQREKHEEALYKEKEKLELRNKIIEREKENLQADYRNVNIALDYINDALKFIFFSTNRVTLENKNGKYCVKSRGQHIKPYQLSVGERNAISLAYFFCSMFDNCNTNEKYTKERLIVIDDPISSFDFENRVGILSFLQVSLEKILKGNRNSKILLLSHDIQTIFDLIKSAKSIITNTNKSLNDKDKVSSCCCRIEKKQAGNTELTSDKNVNEYKTNLHEIFNFAKDNTNISPEKSFGIGNKMRRVAEAISTFLYKCGFEDLLRKDELLRDLTQERQNHYRNTLFRLIFHGMSHSEEKVKNFNPVYEAFSPHEVRNIARSFLLFLNDTHKHHLSSFLEADEIDIIKSWEVDFFKEN